MLATAWLRSIFTFAIFVLFFSLLVIWLLAFERHGGTMTCEDRRMPLCQQQQAVFGPRALTMHLIDFVSLISAYSSFDTLRPRRGELGDVGSTL